MILRQLFVQIDLYTVGLVNARRKRHQKVSANRVHLAQVFESDFLQYHYTGQSSTFQIHRMALYARKKCCTLFHSENSALVVVDMVRRLNLFLIALNQIEHHSQEFDL